MPAWQWVVVLWWCSWFTFQEWFEPAGRGPLPDLPRTRSVRSSGGQGPPPVSIPGRRTVVNAERGVDLAGHEFQ